MRKWPKKLGLAKSLSIAYIMENLISSITNTLSFLPCGPMMETFKILEGNLQIGIPQAKGLQASPAPTKGTELVSP